MKRFQDWSIHHKLTGLFLAMACIAALTLSIPMVTFDVLMLRQAISQDLSTLTEVLAQNSSAAIAFHDAKAARNVLNALRAEPGVAAACIYTTDGKPFATYVREGKSSGFVPPPMEAPGTRFERGHLIQFQKIVLVDESVGTIYIESNLNRLNANLQKSGIIFLVTITFTLLFALVVAARFQRPIAGPLVNLVKTAKAISSTTNYSIRTECFSQDEFGQVAEAFNGMLDQIESRDQKLRDHGVHLEEQVASRTSELLTMNAQLSLQAASLEAAANSIVITDRTGAIVWANGAFTKLTGYALEEVLGKNPKLLSSGEHGNAFYKNLWETIASGQVWHGEITNRRKNGSHYTEEMTITPVVTNGEITHFVGVKQDISERKRAETALQQAEGKYRAIFEDSVVGIFQTTPEGCPLSINRALANMHGYDSPEQLLAEVSNVAQQLFVDSGRLNELRSELDEKGVVRGVELELCRKDGARKWALVNVRAVRDADGKVVLHEGTVEDITDRKVAEERVQYLAYYDALTGLPNRTLLTDRLAKAFAGARRRNERVALLFMDLDRFKLINDSLGHTAGDLLLQAVAERLRGWVREQDTVARLGGDEFLIVLSAIKDLGDAGVAADRIMKVMIPEFLVQGQPLSIACSLGISVFPDHGTDAETLFKNADTAMYSAKEKGRNNFQFFTQGMNDQIVERLMLEKNLRLAFERSEFFLVYQPQIDVATGRLTGLEALLRWQHPKMGLVPPDKFIRIAENCGLIVPLGEWVLKSACSQASEWHREGLLEVPVAVNVSAVQFRQEGFLDLVRRVLEETSLGPQYLELEITESLLLSNSDIMLSVLRELKDMGVKLAIDDFGTGYSSLSYLRQFPVSKLKIDRSFVQNVAVNPDDAAITGTIISMGKSLNLKVIAEGVETEEQMSFLRAHHCDEIQGYYFSKPLTADKLATKLHDTLHLASCSNQDVRQQWS
ncbi:MAG: EAL domain-containing protein [Candidatus Acidiferrum sp.]